MENTLVDRHPDSMAEITLPEDTPDPDEIERSPEVHGGVDYLMRCMHHKGDLPAFSGHVIEINTKLSSLTAVNFSSAGDLAKIILKDVSLTNKLLKVVNSALYAGMSGKVTTISKALLLLGIEKVRIIAATLMIFDHLENKSKTKELKEVALSSLMSGLIATSVAESMKLPGKEEVFICAMLYNLGKMLTICYFPEEYEEIKKRIAEAGLDENKTSQSVLGVSYNELGMAVARSWNYPAKIVGSMEPLAPQVLDQAKTELGSLRVLASYSNELLFNLINTPAPERAEVISSMSKRYAKRIPIPEEQMRSLLESTATKVNPYADVVKTDKKTSNLFKNLFRSDPDRLTEVQNRKAATPAKAPVLAERSVAPGALTDATDAEPTSSILDNGLREIKEVMKGRYNLNDVLYMILETMYRGFELNRVIFCLRDAAQGRMVGRFGLGDNVDEMVKRFHFRVSRSSDLFNIVIAQEKGILINDASSPNILKMLPGWYRGLVAAPSFFIYPLISARGCLGMFYADKKTRGNPLTEGERNVMEELRDIFLSAISQKS